MRLVTAGVYACDRKGLWLAEDTYEVKADTVAEVGLSLQLLCACVRACSPALVPALA